MFKSVSLVILSAFFVLSACNSEKKDAPVEEQMIKAEKVPAVTDVYSDQVMTEAQSRKEETKGQENKE